MTLSETDRLLANGEDVERLRLRGPGITNPTTFVQRQRSLRSNKLEPVAPLGSPGIPRLKFYLTI